MQGVIRDVGYPGLFLLIVLESTLVPVPSMLVMPFAGFLAATTSTYNLPAILFVNSAAALSGSLLSYWLGAAGGKPLLLKYGKYVLVRAEDLAKAEAFFAEKGGWTIFIARFVPVIRHVISVPAGIARMPLSPFILQTFLGASLWGGGLMVVGYVLGARWQEVMMVAKRIDLVIAAAVVLALVVVAITWFRRRRRQVTESAVQ